MSELPKQWPMMRVAMELAQLMERHYWETVALLDDMGIPENAREDAMSGAAGLMVALIPGPLWGSPNISVDGGPP